MFNDKLKNDHENSKPNRKYARIAVAAVCSLLVFSSFGIFLKSEAGTRFVNNIFSRQESNKPEDKSAAIVPIDVSAALQTDETETTESDDTKPAVTTRVESGAPTHNSFRDGGIYNFGSYEAIVSALEKSWSNSANNYNYGITDGITSGTITEDATAGNSSPAAEQGKNTGAADYSQTNIQVEGVDEADIIKNDGEYIYCILNSSLYVLDVRNPQNMKVAAVIADDFSLTDYYANYLDLFYDSDSKTLSVISNSYYGDPNIIYPSEPVLYDEGNDTASVQGCYGYPSQECTKLQTYDVSDAYAPKEIRTFYQEGYYISSRRIDDTVYLVTSQSLWYDSAAAPEELIPSTSDGKDNWTTIPAQDIFIVNPDYANTFTIVSAVDTRSVDSAAVTQAVIGQGTVVYASMDTLYIAASVWDEKIYQTYEDSSLDNAGTDTSVTAPDDMYKTKILAFSITGGTLSAKASGTVNGTLLNQYSMDEYQGYLRTATTSGGWTTDTSNNIYVLDKNLDTVSGLTGLAPGEQIYSARFDGDRIYLVTFEQVDPFFVIDASDPSSIKVLGKLKIPGYSNYMQMLGDNLVLAIGNTTYTNGGSVIPAGLKIAVFDVTDPANPTLKSSLIYGDSYGYSDVQYNPKALLLNQSRGLIGLPVCFDMPAGSFGTEYVNGYLLLTYDDSGKLSHDYLFKDIDTFLSYGMCRGISIENTIFLVGYEEVLAYDLDTHELIGSLSLYQQ